MVQDQFQIRIESLQKTVEDLSKDLREKEERLAAMALNFQKAEKSETGAKMQVNAIIEYFKDCHANNISWEDALRKVDDFRRYDVRFNSLTELLSFLDSYERVVHDLEEENPGLKKDM